MALGLTDDQRALADSLRGWARDRGTAEVVKAAEGSGPDAFGDAWTTLAGLGVVAGSYRDALATGEGRHAAALAAAVMDVHGSIETLERNPNEALLLQSLLLRLPSLTP